MCLFDAQEQTLLSTIGVTCIPQCLSAASTPNQQVQIDSANSYTWSNLKTR